MKKASATFHVKGTLFFVFEQGKNPFLIHVALEKTEKKEFSIRDEL